MGAGNGTAAWQDRAPDSERVRVTRPSAAESTSFAGDRFPPEAILLAAHWYLEFGFGSHGPDVVTVGAAGDGAVSSGEGLFEEFSQEERVHGGRVRTIVALLTSAWSAMAEMVARQDRPSGRGLCGFQRWTTPTT